MKKLLKMTTLIAVSMVAIISSLASAGAANASELGTVWNNAFVPSGVAGLNSIAYGDGSFVGVNASGDFLQSSDGKTWTKKMDANELNSVAFGNGTFAILGYSGTEAVAYYSTDGGETYILGTIPSGLNVKFTAIAFSGGEFVATGGDGSDGYSLYSTDGITWVNGDNLDDSDITVGLAIGNGAYVTTTPNASIDYTTDPVNQGWGAVQPFQFTGYVPQSGGAFSQIVFTGSKFYTLYGDGSNTRLYSSTDCSSWDDVITTGLDGKVMFALTWTGTEWFAGAGGTDTGIYHSVDGVNWTQVDGSSTQWWSIVYGNSMLVAGGQSQGPTVSALDTSIAIAWSVAPAPLPDTGGNADYLPLASVVGGIMLALGVAVVYGARRKQQL